MTEMIPVEIITKKILIIRGQKVILDNLGGFPEESEHCALLASDTLKEALRNYLAYKREPWKKAYKKP